MTITLLILAAMAILVTWVIAGPFFERGRKPFAAGLAAFILVLSAATYARLGSPSPPEFQTQTQMIGAMVGKLEARLAANPKDAEGWAMLMKSYVVIGAGDKAKAARDAALAAFADDSDTQSKLRDFAAKLGIN